MTLKERVFAYQLSRLAWMTGAAQKQYKLVDMLRPALSAEQIMSALELTAAERTSFMADVIEAHHHGQ